MRKLLFIAAGILAMGLVSCEKQGGIPNNDNDNAILKGGISTQNLEEPVGSGDDPSNEGIDPMLIPPLPGENDKGGNRTCEAVYFWLGEGEDYLCGDKVDYDGDAEGFASSFPRGLNVTVEGIYISFTVNNCIEIEDDLGEKTYWKVGAVIVKGSNAANIYYYGPEGISADGNLFAPGEKPMVSNLTFCFVPCEQQQYDMYYAAKVWYLDETGAERWAVTDGTTPHYSGTGEWCDFLGFGGYPVHNMKLVDKAIKTDGPPPIYVGDVTIDASGNIEILLNNEEFELSRAYLYWGDMTDLTGSPCATYTAAPWIAKTSLSGEFAEFVNGTDFNIPAP